MNKTRVLFVCDHNSARSQIAEALTNKYFSDVLQAESAGLDPGAINPLAIAALSEIGIDISENTTSSVFEKYKNGERFDIVVTVCSKAEAQCPVFPGISKRLHIPFDDPETLTGSDVERLENTRRIREDIRKAVGELARSARNEPSTA